MTKNKSFVSQLREMDQTHKPVEIVVAPRENNPAVRDPEAPSVKEVSAVALVATALCGMALTGPLYALLGSIASAILNVNISTEGMSQRKLKRFAGHKKCLTIAGLCALGVAAFGYITLLPRDGLLEETSYKNIVKEMVEAKKGILTRQLPHGTTVLSWWNPKEERYYGMMLKEENASDYAAVYDPKDGKTIMDYMSDGAAAVVVCKQDYNERVYMARRSETGETIIWRGQGTGKSCAPQP